MKPMEKRILSLLVAILTFCLMNMALISCGNETQSSVKEYKYCIFYIQEVGDGLEGEKGREWEYKVSCHYNTEQLTVEYREGVMYQVSFEIYEADGTYRGERGDFGARGKPGTYYFDAPENAHDYATKAKHQKLESEKGKIAKRLNVIGKVVKKLYEDYVSGELNDGNYQDMLNDYQAEQKKLNQRLSEITALLSAATNQNEKIKKFKEIATQYLDFEELTAELVANLIDHIEIGLSKQTDGRVTREINIVYRFIG